MPALSARTIPPAALAIRLRIDIPFSLVCLHGCRVPVDSMGRTEHSYVSARGDVTTSTTATNLQRASNPLCIRWATLPVIGLTVPSAKTEDTTGSELKPFRQGGL